MQSKEAGNLICRMIKELAQLGYGYRQTVGGCYDALINNYGYQAPPEGKESTVDEVIKVLNRIM